MTDTDVTTTAAHLLREAIRARRLARRPDPGMLMRVASVIGPILVAQKAERKRTIGAAKKNRHGLDTVAIKQEVADGSGAPAPAA